MSFQHTHSHTSPTPPSNIFSTPTTLATPNHPRGRPSSREDTTPTREASMESYSTSSSTEEYSTKVTREADMDIDDDFPKASWADQVDEAQPFRPVTHNVTTTHPGNASNTPTSSLHPTRGNDHEHETAAPGSPSAIPYDVDGPANPALWDGDFARISIFGTKESFLQDATNVSLSLKRAAAYIRQTNLAKGDPNSLPQLNLFGDAAWDFISAVYESKWDQLHVKSGISFRNKVANQFNTGRSPPPNPPNRSSQGKSHNLKDPSAHPSLSLPGSS